MRQRLLQGGGPIRFIGNNMNANAGALPDRFHNHGERQGPALSFPENLVLGRGNAFLHKGLLAQELVERPPAGLRPGTRVRDPARPQDFLYLPVLSKFAVQRDKHRLDPVRQFQFAPLEIDLGNVVAHAPKSLRHGPARVQGDFPLRRRPAH